MAGGAACSALAEPTVQHDHSQLAGQRSGPSRAARACQPPGAECRPSSAPYLGCRPHRCWADCGRRRCQYQCASLHIPKLTACHNPTNRSLWSFGYSSGVKLVSSQRTPSGQQASLVLVLEWAGAPLTSAGPHWTCLALAVTSCQSLHGKHDHAMHLLAKHKCAFLLMAASALPICVILSTQR